MRNITIKVTGRTELLMHNSRLVNPMEPATKELAAAWAVYKRDKTDEAFEELCKAEFLGSLYHDERLGPYYPTDNLHSCLKAAGAKIVKKGRTTFKNIVATALLPGDTDINPLSYAAPARGQQAPRERDGLWASSFYRDIRPARVGSSTVMRTRPKFTNWAFEVPFELDTELLDIPDLERILNVAGKIVGLGDWRPAKGGRRGRFDATVTDHGEFLDVA